MPDTWRWQVRTASITETCEALSGLWGRVARETRTTGRPDDHLRTGEDPTVRVRTRTSVLTLVVVAVRPETVDRAMAVVSTLASRHPSRAIVLSPGDPDGP